MKNLIFVVGFLGVAGGAIWLLAGGTEGKVEGQPAPTTTSTASVPNKNDDKTPAPFVRSKGPQPECVIQQTEYNFGGMLVGDSVSHRFLIENHGEGDLVLRAGKPTCKCTTFAVGKNVLKKGESTELVVEIKGKQPDENFSHGGPVYTNDIHAQEVQFRVNGVVSVPVFVFPPEVWLVKANDIPEEGLIIGFLVSRAFEKLSIKSIEYENKDFNLEWYPATEEQMTVQEWEKAKSAVAIVMKVGADLPPMLVREPVTVHIDQHHAPIQLEIELQKRGPIRIMPKPGARNYQWHELQQGLQMGEFSRETDRTVELQLFVEHSEFKEALQLTEIEASPKYLQVEMDKGKALGKTKRRYTLKITIPAGYPATSRGKDNPAVLKIQTNHPSGQRIDLQMTFRTF